MKYLTVTKASYTSESGDVIDCLVDFEGVGVLPFCASKNDPELHGQQIYDELVAGAWGEVAAFVPPAADALAAQIAEAMRERKRGRFAEASAVIDTLQFAVDSGEATNEEIELLAKWQQYRLAVMRAKSTGTELVLPEKPADVDR